MPPLDLRIDGNTVLFQHDAYDSAPAEAVYFGCQVGKGNTVSLDLTKSADIHIIANAMAAASDNGRPIVVGFPLEAYALLFYGFATGSSYADARAWLEGHGLEWADSKEWDAVKEYLWPVK